MRIMQATLFQIAIWSGIYWGAYQGVVPVANLLGVGLTLGSLFCVTVLTLAHVFFEDNRNAIRDVWTKNRHGPVLIWLFRINVYAQAVTLIAIGGNWVLLGTIWLIVAIMAHLLTVRSQSVDTQAV